MKMMRFRHRFRVLSRVILGIFDSRRALNYWESRDFSEARTGYAINLYAPSNQFLYEKLVPDFESVLEIGSNCGNRIMQLAEQNPSKRFVGIDINKEAINLGRKIALEKDLKNIDFLHINLNDLNDEQLQSLGKFDVTFTWATAIYVHPREIKKFLQRIEYLSSNQIILIERNLSGPSLLSYLDYFYSAPNWGHDYERLLKVIDENLIISKLRVPANTWAPGGGMAYMISAIRN